MEAHGVGSCKSVPHLCGRLHEKEYRRGARETKEERRAMSKMSILHAQSEKRV